MFFDTSDLYTDEIRLILVKTCEADSKKMWLPAYYFRICLLDGTPIGKIELRIGLNAKTYVGGNIGYAVEEAYRGHHYAGKACRLLFQLAKKHGMRSLIISCVPTNQASARTCEWAGGRLVEIAEVPYFSEMYEEGKREVCIYRFDLDETGIGYRSVGEEHLGEIREIYAKESWNAYLKRADGLGCAFRNSLFCLGAFDGEKLIGFIRCVGDGEHILLVQDLIVAPEYRHQGIGTALFETVWGKYSHVRMFCVLTDAGDEMDNHFYQSFGMKTLKDRDMVGYIR